MLNEELGVLQWTVWRMPLFSSKSVGSNRFSLFTRSKHSQIRLRWERGDLGLENVRPGGRILEILRPEALFSKTLDQRLYSQ